MQGYFEWPLDNFIVSYGDNHINVHSHYSNDNYFYRDDTIRPDHLKEDVFRSAAEMFGLRRNYFRNGDVWYDAMQFYQEAIKHSDEIGLSEETIRDIRNKADQEHAKQTGEFKKNNLDQILMELRTMGFNVERDEAMFKFHFVNRKTPYEVKPQSQRIHQGDVIIETFDKDDLLDEVERRLKPVQGRKYMPSALKTWDEFRAIRYRQPRVEVETQPWEAFKNAKQII